MSEPAYHRQGAAEIKADLQRIEAIERRLPVAYERWAELEARASTPKQAEKKVRPRLHDAGAMRPRGRQGVNQGRGGVPDRIGSPAQPSAAQSIASVRWQSVQTPPMP
jgi:hypothetical protein